MSDRQRLQLRHPAAGETSLYLVRHGRTEANVRQVLHGLTDLPLDALGRRQAAAIAGRLARETEPDVLLSSPLQRAMETATIIGQAIGLAPLAVPGLVEINFGDLEGVSFGEFALRHSDLATRFLDDNDLEVGWPGGETRRAFYQRVETTFLEILEQHARHRVVVVAHGGVIGAFLSRLMGLSPNAPEVYDIVNCSLSHLDVGAEDSVLHVRNDTVHLEVLDDPTGEVEVLR